jgi:DNA (cytosine-5)-methyltransferase 1
LKHADIGVVSPRGLRLELRLERGDLDLLAGCPPCQGFSTLRTRNGSRRNRDARNGLVHEMTRFAREFLPRAIMMENVPRLMRHSSFKDLCKELRALGYQINVAVKDAAHFGVPQRRRRLILLAGLGFDIALAKETDQIVTVRKAIGEISRYALNRDALHNLPERRSDKVAALIRDIPKDGGSRLDLPRRRQLSCHRKSDGFRDIYGRMAWEKVTPTITSGCFNPSKGRFLHPQEDRAISMREAAILQSFPPNYSFPINRGKEAIALMIGNALPPEFIRRHALQIKRALKSST